MSQGPYKRDGETVDLSSKTPVQQEPDASEPKYRDRDWLYYQYYTKEKTTRDIADEYGYGQSTISLWVGKHDIPQPDRSETEADVAERPYRDPEWLYTQYIVLKKSTTTIADELDVGNSTISTWLDNHGIETRSGALSKAYTDRPDAKWRTESWLRGQYLDQDKSIQTIAEESDTTGRTIHNWLCHHGIERRSPSSKPQKYYEDRDYTDEEWLRHQYADLQKSGTEIANECDVSSTTIYTWLEKHDIEPRSQSDGVRLYRGRQNAVSKRIGNSRELVGNDLSIDASWEDFSDRNVVGSWTPYRDESWLREQHCEEGRSTVDIADECGVSGNTIRYWMEKYDIERRSPGRCSK